MYIGRNSYNEITLVSRVATPDCVEYVPAGSPELLAFIEREGDEHLRLLRSTDNELACALEDLIEKRLIDATALPGATRQALTVRRSMRYQITVAAVGEGAQAGRYQ